MKPTKLTNKQSKVTSPFFGKYKVYKMKSVDD
jgi:hypothetical protein